MGLDEEIVRLYWINCDGCFLTTEKLREYSDVLEDAKKLGYKRVSSRWYCPGCHTALQGKDAPSR